MSGPTPEPDVQVPSSRPLWVALLAGPALWFGHFMAVYLLLEVVCAGLLAGPADTIVRGGVIGVTAVVLVVLGVAAQRTWAARQPGEGMDAVLMRVGVVLDGFFAVAVLVVALPVVVLPPC